MCLMIQGIRFQIQVLKPCVGAITIIMEITQRETK